VSTYPVTFEADYVERRSRLTTFFRLLLVIPHLLIVAFWGLAVFFGVIVAWFALLFTGRWPLGLYMFTANFLKYFTRVSGYCWLLTDPYPPFPSGVNDDPDYPVRLNVAAPQAEYSRLKVLLRIFYIIPAYLIVYVLGIVLDLVGIVSWFVIVITGKQPKGLQDVIRLCVSYTSRAYALMLLVTETYPPFTDDDGRQLQEPAPATPLPAQPAPVAPEAPAAATPAPAAPAGFEPPVAPPVAPQPDPPPTAAPPAPEQSSEDDEEPPPGPFGPSSNA
jgi:hypothetical protein